ncbi:MAG: phenylalanine--tRNA ligase subunit beta [Chloroflexi bacterium]|nr:phenylalanine--tRNA ligase subunit beta [Chloroflexota bacterium]
MKVPWSWLADYVDLTLSPEDLAYRLTMAGAEVEAIEKIGGSWDKVVVGLVKEVNPHPNADRLTIALVEDGKGHTYRVISGAPNMPVGSKDMKVPLALPGARLIDPDSDRDSAERKEYAVKPAKIRGVVSEAVICSELELGISSDHEGVLILEDEAPLGAPLSQHLGETVLDFKLTPNQAHLLSIVGIAREVAALTAQKLRLPSTELKSTGRPIQELVQIEVQDEDLCPRYSASVILEVKPGPSPAWLQRRLRAAGMRPINNIVDVTNYIMLESGQPLHAFDFDKLRGHKIIVRRAGPGATFTTLDGVGRQLLPETLVIADGEGAVAIGGVMGGLESEVSDATRAVLLESANFERASIRRTSRALRIRSEASIRFDKGLDPESTIPALRRATQLIQELAGGEIAEGFIDLYPNPVAKKRIELPLVEVERLLGVARSREEVKGLLASLEFTSRQLGRDILLVEVPTYRQDVTEAADLVEEIARLWGYDKIPSTLFSEEVPTPKTNWDGYWETEARQVLAEARFYEAMTYSLVNNKDLEAFPSWAVDDGERLRISNPMVPEEDTLRTTLLPSLLRNISPNLRDHEEVSLFELARVYQGRKGDLPEEKRRLALASAGISAPDWATAKRLRDFYDLKGAIEALLRALGISGFQFVSSNYPSFGAGRQGQLILNGKQAGILGEVHPKLMKEFDLGKATVIVAELDFDLLASLASPDLTVKPLPRYPAVVQDLALILDQSIAAAQVEELIREAGGRILEEVRLFDVYQGEGIPSGKKSLAYSLSYRSPDRTLTAEEVSRLQEKIVSYLAKKAGARLRE